MVNYGGLLVSAASALWQQNNRKRTVAVANSLLPIQGHWLCSDIDYNDCCLICLGSGSIYLAVGRVL